MKKNIFILLLLISKIITAQVMLAPSKNILHSSSISYCTDKACYITGLNQYFSHRLSGLVKHVLNPHNNSIEPIEKKFLPHRIFLYGNYGNSTPLIIEKLAAEEEALFLKVQTADILHPHIAISVHKFNDLVIDLRKQLTKEKNAQKRAILLIENIDIDTKGNKYLEDSLQTFKSQIKELLDELDQAKRTPSQDNQNNITIVITAQDLIKDRALLSRFGLDIIEVCDPNIINRKLILDWENKAFGNIINDEEIHYIGEKTDHFSWGLLQLLLLDLSRIKQIMPISKEIINRSIDRHANLNKYYVQNKDTNIQSDLEYEQDIKILNFIYEKSKVEIASSKNTATSIMNPNKLNLNDRIFLQDLLSMAHNDFKLSHSEKNERLERMNEIRKLTLNYIETESNLNLLECQIQVNKIRTLILNQLRNEVILSKTYLAGDKKIQDYIDNREKAVNTYEKLISEKNIGLTPNIKKFNYTRNLLLLSSPLILLLLAKVTKDTIDIIKLKKKRILLLKKPIISTIAQISPHE